MCTALPNRATFQKRYAEAVARRCSVKNVFFEISQNSQENSCATVFFCNFIKKETLAQAFSSEFCEISKNTSGSCFWIWPEVIKLLRLFSKLMELKLTLNLN